MKQIETVFDHLDAWRHLPSYQLERRADIFFSLYLPEALERKLGCPMYPDVLPEFPLRIGTLDPVNSNLRLDNRSYKADYLAFSNSFDKAVLVELKTDELSRKLKQDEYLLKAREVGLTKLLEGVRELFKKTKSTMKYLHLIEQLGKMGLLRIPFCPTDCEKIKDSACEIEIVSRATTLDVLYIQPNADSDESNMINFHDFAEIVRKHDDPLSRRFAGSLKEWATKAAGER